MKNRCIDTNVIIRYLVENPSTVNPKFKGVFTFFPRVEKGEITVELADLVVFEAFFVLTRHYKVPQKEAAEKLALIISFKGFRMSSRPLMLSCLKILREKKVDMVDAYLLVLAAKKGIHEIYSYDKNLSRQGLKLLEIF